MYRRSPGLEDGSSAWICLENPCRPRFQNIARHPPGRSTRASSGSARGQSNQWKDSPQKTPSTLESASGIASAVPSRTSASAGMNARMPARGSIAITGSKYPSRRPVNLPVPAPRSTTAATRGRPAASTARPGHVGRPKSYSAATRSNVAAAASISGTSGRAEDVQPADQHGDPPRGNCRQTVVDEAAHHASPAREKDEWDERERDAEREHDLAEDERTVSGSTPSDRRPGERRRRGDRAPQEHRDLAADEALHDHWPAIVPTDDDDRPDASSAIPRRVAAPLPGSAVEGRVRLLDGFDLAPVEPRRHDRQHREVDDPAIVIAIITSIRSKRWIRVSTPSSRLPIRSCVSAKCR